MSATPQNEVLPPGVVSFVTGVVLLAIVVSALILTGSVAASPLAILFWTAAFLAGEAMSFRTPTGKGNVSMAAALHLAALPVAGASVLIPAVWLSRLVANLMIQRQRWYKALFNAAQVSLVLVTAMGLYKAFGGSQPVVLDRTTLPVLAPSLFAAMVGYYLVNTGLVCGVLALSTGMRYFRTWRENFGYRVEIVSSIALFLLAPIATLAYQGFGQFGLAVFLLPMLFIRDACDRYIALERTQRALIGSERLAAKGEVAASVGHELNNYLSVLSGNLQMVQMRQDSMSKEQRQERLKRIGEQVTRMTSLSKGLMSFSHLESRPLPTDLPRLVQETVEFLRPQNRYDRIAFSVDCDPRVGVVTVDPAQIQQILMNLINNAADAMREAEIERPAVSVWLRWQSTTELVELGVRDSGPGVPEEIRRRIFEPSFTTKTSGHGFGLSTVFRIVSNHGGTIEVDEAPGGGALFRVLLPSHATSSRHSSAA